MDKIDSRLVFVFQTVNEHLRFAESKNLAITVIDIGILTIAFSIFNEYDNTKIVYICALVNVIIFQTLSLVVSISSFSARTTVLNTLIGKRIDNSGNNMIFFGHIAGLSERELLEKYIGINGYDSAEKYYKDLSHQIVANSRIACRKFSTFNIALWFFIASLGTPLLAIILLNIYQDEAI